MKSIFHWLRGRKDWLIEYLKYRSILFGSLHIDQARHDESFEGAFNEAKKISDFVGMFLRLSFLSLISSIFLVVAQRRDGLISYAYVMCWVYSLGLLIALQRRVGIVILLYLAGDIPKHDKKIIRLMLAIIAMATHLMLTVGIYSMMYELARHNTFFQEMTKPETKKNEQD